MEPNFRDVAIRKKRKGEKLKKEIKNEWRKFATTLLNYKLPQYLSKIILLILNIFKGIWKEHLAINTLKMSTKLCSHHFCLKKRKKKTDSTQNDLLIVRAESETTF